MADKPSSWRGNATDLILMDRYMPVMDGFEAAFQIRQIPTGGRRHHRFVRQCMEEDRVQSQKAGSDIFLPKPFTGQSFPRSWSSI